MYLHFQTLHQVAAMSLPPHKFLGPFVVLSTSDDEEEHDTDIPSCQISLI